ncbi:Nicotinate-nucleotide--dimethylbenzimidazole phosphoribosyltransferase [Desulfurella amilsii]|uniref:Nicotinate-nucleotide--dimethylbenzimidazole phosphoribosyltransferase n=1 Tax=Desulfurella amilsii TaxID=1562698 RepID=A0A1X4XUP8_9BACT|nr:nicotinate-nucleotide--dimethylbenzimidazole phosphoribosyltransferase [Desulfurella amilsii]OSS41259.1 Nicotinate-nucleotide--dimethylbenzimidazole phosphoribosyltransferase [Desulfurella amilsii]
MKVEEILSKIVPINEEIYKQANQRTSKLIMPYRAMGYLNDISEQLCAIYSSMSLKIENKAVFVMAADHGVAEEDVSAYPQQVTCEMIKAFIKGNATITVLARLNNCSTIVADVGTKCDLSEKEPIGQNQFIIKKVKNGTNNFAKQPAMTKEEAYNSILTGFKIADEYITSKKLNLIATGDMGIANTTAASAVGACITKNNVELITGRGTLITDDTLENKIAIIKKSLNLHNPSPNDPIDVLSKVGGLEIGAIAGVILAACYNKIPVVIDGLISTAGALLAYKLNPLTKQYMFAGHLSYEPGHSLMLSYLGLRPILQLDMRLGEGSGAVLAMPIIEAAAKIITQVATFDEAQVTKSSL